MWWCRGDGHSGRVLWLLLLLLLLRRHVVVVLVIGKVLSGHILLLLLGLLDRWIISGLVHWALVVLTVIALFGDDARPVSSQGFQVLLFGRFRLLFVHLFQFILGILIFA